MGHVDGVPKATGTFQEDGRHQWSQEGENSRVKIKTENWS